MDSAGRTPYRAESLCADGRGNVYLVGDWRVKADEVGTLLSSLSYSADPNNPRYYDMWRGQFFAAVRLTGLRPASGPAASAPAGKPASSQPAADAVDRPQTRPAGLPRE